MWVKQCHKPPKNGNGKFIPAINMVMTGGWFTNGIADGKI